jgi:chemotaxis protein methyltransferase CheR
MMVSPLDHIGTLIAQRTGLSVTTRFRSDFQYILRQVAGEDLTGFGQILQHSPLSAPEWQALVQALTIGETYFFRDADTFRLLRAQVLLPLIRQRRESRRLALNIWCAGCATGEEPYSVAITLLDTLPDLDHWQINLTGTDINAGALEHARAGVYRDWAFRHCPPDIQKRYFDAAHGGWQIKPQVRRMVTFRQANLLDPPAQPPYDLVFCRNVLIYLTRDNVAKIESGMHGALHPGGWLLLGPSEAMHTHRERWITHVFPGAVFYQKSPQAKATPVTRRHVITNGATNPAQRSNPDPYRAAVTAVHNDQPQEAERLLAELLAERPDHAPARTLLAYIFANRQALPEAHAHLDAALRSDSMFSDAHYLRATLYLEAGQPIEADKALRAALYCRRDHPLATFLMGNLLAQAGDVLRANRAWAAARTQIDPLSPDTRISDLSDMTAATFKTLIQAQIDSLGLQG